MTHHFFTRASVPARPRERGSRPFPSAMASVCCASVVASAPVRAANGGRRTRAFALPAPPRLKISTRRGDACVTHATKETYASFDDMIERSPVPVLVDFYATWCGPCQMLSRDVLPKVAGAVGKDRVKLVVGPADAFFPSASCSSSFPSFPSSSASSVREPNTEKTTGQFPARLTSKRHLTNTTRLLPPAQKINTEKYPNIASKYKVEALPTIMLFKEGKVADRIEGMPNAPQLIDRLLYFLQ